MHKCLADANKGTQLVKSSLGYERSLSLFLSWFNYLPWSRCLHWAASAKYFSAEVWLNPSYDLTPWPRSRGAEHPHCSSCGKSWVLSTINHFIGSFAYLSAAKFLCRRNCLWAAPQHMYIYKCTLSLSWGETRRDVALMLLAGMDEQEEASAG